MTDCGTIYRIIYFYLLLAKGSIRIAHEHQMGCSYGRTWVVNGTNIATLEVVKVR